MSKKVNPAAVGIFVAGAVIILVIGLIVLGSGKIFEKRGKFVAYFQSSANGLQVGSDVLLGGVAVGSVTNMRVQFDPDSSLQVIPVVIELSADRIVALSADTDYTKDDILSEESIRDAIENQGLRARLMVKSALTGQLYVDLDFLPGDETGYVFPAEPIDGLLQIPTVKSEIQLVLERITAGLEGLGALGIDDLIADINTLVNNLDDKVAELDLEGISDKANSTLAKADTTFAEINGSLDDGQLEKILTSIDEAAAELNALIASIDVDQFNEAVRSADGTIDAAEVTVRQIGVAAVNVGELTDQRATSAVSFNRTLVAIERASRSIQELADFLKRNPSALISGKKQP